MSSQKQTVRFGPFELDIQIGELRKNDIRLKLQGQPIQILEMLLAKPGELVTRGEIQQRLWSTDTFVDFDLSLNTAVKKLRQALGDEADAPRYVETLPKRGYRFIGKVEAKALPEDDPASAEAPVVTHEQAASPPTDGTSRRTWVDGSEKRQLTSPPIAVGGPHWSPDGKLIVFNDMSNGDRRQMRDTTPTRVYVVSRDGGAPNLLLAGDEGPVDPTWSPDGISMAYSSTPNGIPRDLRILNTQTMKSSKLQGSEGLRAPSWSPDGKYLVALSGDPGNIGSYTLMLFTFATQTWQELASGTEFGWECWSRDSKFVQAVAGDWLIRIDVSSHKRENVVSLAGFRSTAYLMDKWDLGWFGLSPDDRPVTTRDTGVRAIYAFDLEYK